MAKKKHKAEVRTGAQRLHVYNEGHCVYVHDEEHDDEIRAMLASGEYGEVSNNNFYDNLNTLPFGAVVSKRGLAFAFELEQDDEIEIEVVVGPPLKSEQLADAHWMQPQLTWLRLPSGRLPVDTPNTMPLDHDPGDVDDDDRPVKTSHENIRPRSQSETMITASSTTTQTYVAVSFELGLSDMGTSWTAAGEGVRARPIHNPWLTAAP